MIIGAVALLLFAASNPAILEDILKFLGDLLGGAKKL